MALYHYQVHGNTLKKGVKHWFTVKNHFKHLKGSSDINKPLLNLRSPPPTNSSDLMFYAFSQAQCLRRWKSKSLELLVPFRNTTQSTLQKTRLHSPEERRTSGFSMVFLMMLSLNSYTATPGPRLCRLTHWVPLWTRMRPATSPPHLLEMVAPPGFFSRIHHVPRTLPEVGWQNSVRMIAILYTT